MDDTPWQWEQHNKLEFIGIYTSSGDYVAQVDFEEDAGPTERDRAHARLIAAAPELLAAAKYALQWVQEVDPAVHPSLPMMLRTAIARAEGQEAEE